MLYDFYFTSINTFLIICILIYCVSNSFEQLIGFSYASVITTTFTLLALTYTQNIVYFFILTEILSITIYILLGFNSLKFNNYKSNIIYFLIGFVSSLLFLLCIILINYPESIALNIIGYILGNLSILIKLGVFPVSYYILPVYTNFSNISFFIFSYLIKFTYLQILFLYTIKYYSINFFTYIFIIVVLTALIATYYLSKQTTVKGFLSIASVLNSAILLFSIIPLNSIINLEYNLNITLFTFIFINIYLLNTILFFSISLSLTQITNNNASVDDKNNKKLRLNNDIFINISNYLTKFINEEYAIIAI